MSMRSVRRDSIREDFAVSPTTPIPDVPDNGARVQVHYAGACYTDKQVTKCGKRPKMKAINDTSLYPGFEVSGVVDQVGTKFSFDKNAAKRGDHVIIYPSDEEEHDQGFSDYVVVNDITNLIRVPDSLDLRVAAMLPSGGLTAMAAVSRIKHFVLEKIDQREGKRPVNVLVVGAGALGLWTVSLAKHFLPSDRDKVLIAVGDTNVERLGIAKDHGCDDIIHWDISAHEEYLLERTASVCIGGPDIIIDFANSPRGVSRTFKALAPGGVLVAGGFLKYEVEVDLHKLALKQQSILGVCKGTRKQLEELVDLTARGEIKAPIYHVFPVADCNKVFEQLNRCEIKGRAVLEVCPNMSPTSP